MSQDPLPSANPGPTATRSTLAGASVARREGREKVTGTARYAAEHTPPGCAYAWPVPATICRGRVLAFDTRAALALPGACTVLTHENAPCLAPPDDPALELLQNDRVPHHGWYVALAVADTLEAARAVAAAVRVTYETETHDVRLTAGHPHLYTPESVNGGYPAISERGDFEGRSPPRPPPSTRRTPCPRCTTTRWNRTPPPPAGRTAT